MKDNSLSDTQSFMMIDDNRYQDMMQIGVTPELLGVKPNTDDPWIVGKDDRWFVYNDKRLHKESWNAALNAAIAEVLKTYPYSAKEARIIREQLK